MKTLIIGGGHGCLAVLSLIQNKRLTTLSPEIAGVVDPNPDAPGVRFAQEQGWPTLTDMYAALALPGLELVIELTGSDHVRDEIFRLLPPRCRFMDHHMAQVFWDLDEVAQHLLDELEQRIQLEMDMREDQLRLQEILDSLPDAVMVLDDEAHIERVNSRYEELTGLRMWQVAGKPCNEVGGAGPECGGPRCPLERVLETGKPLTLVQDWSCLSIGCPHGDCYYEVTASRVRDRRGRMSVVLTSREVTEQVHLKRETEDAARRLTQILDTVHGCISIRDLQGRHVLANPATCRFFGRPKEAFLGKTHQELFPPEVATLFQANDEAAIARGGHSTHEETFTLNGAEHTLITERILLRARARASAPSDDLSAAPRAGTGDDAPGDEATRPPARDARPRGDAPDQSAPEAASSAPALGDDLGEPVAICSVSRDVTESRRLQQELLLAERDAAMGKLAAGVAHELNNPLTGILTFTEELLDEAPEASALSEDLGVILRETLRCRQIVKDLLDYSRRDGLRRQRVSLESILERTLSLLAKQASFHDIEFRQELADGPLLTQGDPNQLQQVLLNLIINARDAQDGQGVITLQAGRQGDQVWISVQDQGVGIPEEQRDLIFDPFFTTKGAQGNGLGLAAVQSIVERHDGAITVESQHNQGARFRVSLPAALDRPTPPERKEGDHV